MASNSTTSDTEAGLPGGNFKPKFSLYSTDTEEQVASVNQGLDRCAALLKTLLTPDKDDDEDHYNRQNKDNHLPNALSSKLKMTSTKTVHTESKKHTHPRASSTPLQCDPTHLRSPPEPRALNDPLNQTSQLPTHYTKDKPTGSKQQQDGRIVTFGCQEEADKRKPKKAYRRLQNEPRKPFVVSKNPAKPRSQVVGVRTRFSRHPGTSHTKTRGKPVASVSKQSVSTKTPSAETHFGNTHNVPKTTHPWCTQPPCLPYPPVSLSGPPHAPVSTNGGLPLPWVPLFPLLNGWLSENSRMVTSTATTVSNAPLMFVPLSVQQKLLEERTLDTAAVSLATPTVTSSNVTTQSKADMQSVMVTASANPTIEQKQTEDGSVKDIEKCLLEEITNIEQRLNSAGQSELVSYLDGLRSRVAEHFRGLEHPLPALSSHWLRQIGQLEQEKAQLLQRVIDSESAYSRAMGELELAQKERSTFHDQVETHRRELCALREDLHSAKEALALMDSQHGLIREKYSERKSLAESRCQELEEENNELRARTYELERDLVLVKRENGELPGRLSEIQCSMERAQEELAMIRVTIAEKDTQLVYTQDQFLGLKQCLAHVLTELKPVDICQSCDHVRLSHDRSYKISPLLVNKLHSLINDGNVDKFLLDTSPSSAHNSTTVQEASGSSCSDTDSTLGGATLDVTLTASHDEDTKPSLKGSLSSVSNHVITPLNLSSEPRTLTPSTREYLPSLLPSLKSSTKASSKTESPLSQLDTLSCLTTSSELEFRNDLASLDADIARLQIQFRVALQTTT